VMGDARHGQSQFWEPREIPGVADITDIFMTWREFRMPPGYVGVEDQLILVSHGMMRQLGFEEIHDALNRASSSSASASSSSSAGPTGCSRESSLLPMPGYSLWNLQAAFPLSMFHSTSTKGGPSRYSSSSLSGH
jgi:hypothetical protein